jgi:hypothetical protein
LASGLVVAYLLWGTGLVSDDFVDLLTFRNKGFPELLVPTGNFVNVPVGHFSHHVWFSLFDLDGIVMDCFKIGFTIASLLLIARFFKEFHGPELSLTVTFLFIFYPSHDSIPYWYAPSGHLLSLALYFTAYVETSRKKFLRGIVLAGLASFMVYGSTPVAVALWALFAMQKRHKAALVMLLPNLVYIAYFVFVSLVVNKAPSRVLEPVTIAALMKQFVLQLVTFVDAAVGPSLWLKVAYAPLELTLLSWLIGAVVLGLLWHHWSPTYQPYDKRLLVCFSLLAFGSFAIFAITGRYPQLAFNLGNRTTFWGSLLVAYILVLLPVARQPKLFLLGMFMFTGLGISEHWKSWNQHQQQVIADIGQNENLQALTPGTIVFVTGNQYSQYGPLSHIEFLSEDWVPRAIFGLVVEPSVGVLSLNGTWTFQNGLLRNPKTSRAIRVKDSITVYDSEANRVFEASQQDISELLASLPHNPRHWVQLGDQGPAKWLRSWAVRLMPRLKTSTKGFRES